MTTKPKYTFEYRVEFDGGVNFITVPQVDKVPTFDEMLKRITEQYKVSPEYIMVALDEGKWIRYTPESYYKKESKERKGVIFVDMGDYSVIRYIQMPPMKK